MVKARLLVQCDLLCPFPGALCDFPYSVHLKWGGMFTHRVEVSSVPDKSWLAGLYPEREADARSGLGLGVRYLDHAARLPFCTKDSISLFIHPSCEAGTWFGSSMGVTSAPFKCGIFENTCRHRVNELTEAYASYVAQEFVSLGVSC